MLKEYLVDNLLIINDIKKGIHNTFKGFNYKATRKIRTYVILIKHLKIEGTCKLARQAMMDIFQKEDVFVDEITSSFSGHSLYQTFNINDNDITHLVLLKKTFNILLTCENIFSQIKDIDLSDERNWHHLIMDGLFPAYSALQTLFSDILTLNQEGSNIGNIIQLQLEYSVQPMLDLWNKLSFVLKDDKKIYQELGTHLSSIINLMPKKMPGEDDFEELLSKVIVYLPKIFDEIKNKIVDANLEIKKGDSSSKKDHQVKMMKKIEKLKSAIGYIEKNNINVKFNPFSSLKPICKTFVQILSISSDLVNRSAALTIEVYFQSIVKLSDLHYIYIPRLIVEIESMEENLCLKSGVLVNPALEKIEEFYQEFSRFVQYVFQGYKFLEQSPQVLEKWYLKYLRKFAGDSLKIDVDSFNETFYQHKLLDNFFYAKIEILRDEKDLGYELRKSKLDGSLVAAKQFFELTRMHYSSLYNGEIRNLPIDKRVKLSNYYKQFNELLVVENAGLEQRLALALTISGNQIYEFINKIGLNSDKKSKLANQLNQSVRDGLKYIQGLPFVSKKNKEKLSTVIKIDKERLNKVISLLSDSNKAYHNNLVHYAKWGINSILGAGVAGILITGNLLFPTIDEFKEIADLESHLLSRIKRAMADVCYRKNAIGRCDKNLMDFQSNKLKKMYEEHPISNSLVPNIFFKNAVEKNKYAYHELFTYEEKNLIRAFRAIDEFYRILDFKSILKNRKISQLNETLQRALLKNYIVFQPYLSSPLTYDPEFAQLSKRKIKKINKKVKKANSIFLEAFQASGKPVSKLDLILLKNVVISKLKNLKSKIIKKKNKNKTKLSKENFYESITMDCEIGRSANWYCRQYLRQKKSQQKMNKAWNTYITYVTWLQKNYHSNGLVVNMLSDLEKETLKLLYKQIRQYILYTLPNEKDDILNYWCVEADKKIIRALTGKPEKNVSLASELHSTIGVKINQLNDLYLSIQKSLRYLFKTKNVEELRELPLQAVVKPQTRPFLQLLTQAKLSDKMDAFIENHYGVILNKYLSKSTLNGIDVRNKNISTRRIYTLPETQAIYIYLLRFMVHLKNSLKNFEQLSYYENSVWTPTRLFLFIKLIMAIVEIDKSKIAMERAYKSSKLDLVIKNIRLMILNNLELLSLVDNEEKHRFFLEEEQQDIHQLWKEQQIIAKDKKNDLEGSTLKKLKLCTRNDENKNKTMDVLLSDSLNGLSSIYRSGIDLHNRIFITNNIVNDYDVNLTLSKVSSNVKSISFKLRRPHESLRLIMKKLKLLHKELVRAGLISKKIMVSYLILFYLDKIKNVILAIDDIEFNLGLKPGTFSQPFLRRLRLLFESLFASIPEITSQQKVQIMTDVSVSLDRMVHRQSKYDGGRDELKKIIPALINSLKEIQKHLLIKQSKLSLENDSQTSDIKFLKLSFLNTYVKLQPYLFLINEKFNLHNQGVNFLRELQSTNDFINAIEKIIKCEPKLHQVIVAHDEQVKLNESLNGETQFYLQKQFKRKKIENAVHLSILKEIIYRDKVKTKINQMLDIGYGIFKGQASGLLEHYFYNKKLVVLFSVGPKHDFEFEIVTKIEQMEKHIFSTSSHLKVDLNRLLYLKGSLEIIDKIILTLNQFHPENMIAKNEITVFEIFRNKILDLSNQYSRTKANQFIPSFEAAINRFNSFRHLIVLYNGLLKKEKIGFFNDYKVTTNLSRIKELLLKGYDCPDQCINDLMLLLNIKSNNNKFRTKVNKLKRSERVSRVTLFSKIGNKMKGFYIENLASNMLPEIDLGEIRKTLSRVNSFRASSSEPMLKLG